MKTLYTLFLCLCLTGLMAQGSIKGKIVDANDQETLIGASVLIQGTTTGTITDVDGTFELVVLDPGDYVLQISYTGYSTLEINVTVGDQPNNIGIHKMESSAIGLAEVTVIASVAIDRRTPVAVSTVSAREIETKIGSQEFPEILKSTPGVFASKEGGGFGDGSIIVRGFNSQNVAVLINGVPINDMENGRVFWSNWAGLTDATQFMQVQRGLGASNVAVPSIGGTINIISKATDYEEGGNVYIAAGNNGYSKIGFGLSSGLTDNGWAFTISGSRTAGDGYVDATQFLSYAYYANIAKRINKKHDLTLTVIGAKQVHGQRQNQSLLTEYENSARGIRFNPDWGYKNGQSTNIEDNFYHKPQISLNHYWKINSTTHLSTAFYASFGTGGGGGTLGVNKFTDPDYRVDGVVDLDRIVSENRAVKEFGAESILRASRNDHQWYGVLSQFTKELGSNFSLLAGLDLRYYKGKHYREVTDLLGADYWLDNDNINNPANVARVGDKIDYYNDGIVNWIGGFFQMEYAKDRLSAFITLNGSNTAYTRVDYFNNLDSDPNQRIGGFNFFGYGVKGGVNYNLTEIHNVFANIGYFEKAPDFRAVFPNFTNETVNDEAVNQKIFSAELGYGLRTQNFTLNVNVYRTEWLDRTFTDGFRGPNGEELIANILGVDALHQGIEFDGVWRAHSRLTLTGMLSIGDWTWQDDIENLEIFDGDTKVGEVDAFIAGLHVGNAAQITGALGLTYKLMPNLRISMDYNYYDKLYARYDPIDRSDEADRGVEAWKIPAFGLLDMNLSYDFTIGDLKTSLYGNVYNITDEKYVMNAQDGADNNAGTARVYYGYGVNWNLGFKIRF